jgi:hypothetical protein
MIQAQVNNPAEASIWGVPVVETGIEWEVYDPPTGTTIIPRNSVGITTPRPQVYTATFTPTQVGAFAVRWTSNGGAKLLGEEDLLVTVGPPTIVVGSGPIPSMAELGSFMRARTKTSGGAEAGVFNADTRPTDAQAATALAGAAVEVYVCTGSDFSGLSAELRARVEEMVRRAVMYRAAMDIELGYWPEQTNTDRSPFQNYKEMYEGRDGKSGILAKVCKAVEDAAGGDEPGVVDDGTGSKSLHSFPVDAGGMQGWSSRW